MWKKKKLIQIITSILRMNFVVHLKSIYVEGRPSLIKREANTDRTALRIYRIYDPMLHIILITLTIWKSVDPLYVITKSKKNESKSRLEVTVKTAQG